MISEQPSTWSVLGCYPRCMPCYPRRMPPGDETPLCDSMPEVQFPDCLTSAKPLQDFFKSKIFPLQAHHRDGAGALRSNRRAVCSDSGLHEHPVHPPEPQEQVHVSQGRLQAERHLAWKGAVGSARRGGEQASCGRGATWAQLRGPDGVRSGAPHGWASGVDVSNF
jgi:hypothetical protein